MRYFEAEIWDRENKRSFIVRKESPFLLKQWLKQHRVLGRYKNKKLLLMRSDV